MLQSDNIPRLNPDAMCSEPVLPNPVSNSGKDHTKTQGPWDHSKNDNVNLGDQQLPQAGDGASGSAAANGSNAAGVRWTDLLLSAISGAGSALEST